MCVNYSTMIFCHKVHGGTKEEDIMKKVKDAKSLAAENSKMHEGVMTVLFFDEANTTEEIGLIKRIMCDDIVLNMRSGQDCGLRIAAACNPYRR